MTDQQRPPVPRTEALGASYRREPIDCGPSSAAAAVPPQRPVDRGSRVVETHTATVFFVDDRVYKLKKAVDLGFFDHRTREARRQACQDEVTLNSRLAPDVYLGVLDISGPDGRPVDHLVAMRRMPDDRRLSRCIERAEDLDRTLRSIAHSVATLHAGSVSEPHHDRIARVEAVRRRWVDGFDQLGPLAGHVAGPERLARIEALVRRYLDGRAPLFEARIAEGWIRDGHGDLQAEDIFVLADGPRILDCIEFGDDYRWGDVLADVAFLAMDLERLGRCDLADQFLRLHRELTADHWPTSLAHHYVAYRAHIRAKVGILRHLQHDEVVGIEVDRLIDLSLAHLEQGRIRLVLVGGLPGTGKSTLAKAVGDHLGAVVLRTDDVRRRLDEPGDRYSTAAVGAVYDEMLAEADRLLGLGETVVLDATWADPAHRQLARAVARRTSSELCELRCTLSRDEAAERIRRRRRIGEDPSEATPAVAEAMATRFAPWPEARVLSTATAPELVAHEAIVVVLDD